MVGGVKAAFWLSLAFVVYAYAGYPLLLAVWARLAPRPIRRFPAAPLPGVSIVLAVRNEAARIAVRIDNLLSLDYPRDKLQIIVVSDGSVDGTLETLAGHGAFVETIALPAVGKAAALNAGVAAARHEIVVFADARQRFEPDAVSHLASAFADPEVGAVSGELVLSRSDAGETSVGEGVGLYWAYEKWIRRNESLIGSTVGATGAIYATRRALWRPLPPDSLLDDVMAPMRIVLAGYRVVFEPAARAFERVNDDASSETRRKTRTLAGNYQMVWHEPRLLLPWRNPIWMQFVSHKLFRLLVPYSLALLLAASVWLARESWVYALALAAQLVFYTLAAYGAALAHRNLHQPAVETPVQFTADQASGGHGDGVVDA